MAFFPFGVVLTQRGEWKNAKTFDQKLIDRYEYDLLALKRSGLNALADFCTRFKTETHLKLMEYYHLYLLNTVTCLSSIYSLPKNHSIFKTVKKFSHHPNLLGWYGQDEPTNYDIYLQNKTRVENGFRRWCALYKRHACNQCYTVGALYERGHYRSLQLDTAI